MRFPTAFSWLAALVSLFVLTVSLSADACDCGGLELDRAVARADAVFLGEVVDVTPNARLSVKRVWKGSPGAVAAFEVPRSNCDFVFPTKGERFLVFARRGPSGGFTTSSCARTAKEKDAAADIAALSK